MVVAAKRALVICFGVGNTYRSALAHGIDVDVVDINPAVPDLARIHQRDPAKTFDDPKGHIFINDGRNFLRSTTESFVKTTACRLAPITTRRSAEVTQRATLSRE